MAPVSALAGFAGAFWLLLTLFPLLYLQKLLHNEIVAVFFLATRRLNLALAIFSILFFPGVFLHEMSHWLMAKILGVRTGRIWLIPQRTPEGNLRMGYVETQRSDMVRDSLIGLAPLLAGSAFVAFAGLAQLDVDAIWNGSQPYSGLLISEIFRSVYTQPDFWLWFYLIFVVSSMMLPSESDRRAWLPLAMFALLLFALGLFAGAGPWLLEHLAPWIDRAFSVGAVVFGISVLVHAVLLAPVFLFRLLLNRLTGLKVVR